MHKYVKWLSVILGLTFTLSILASTRQNPESQRAQEQITNRAVDAAGLEAHDWLNQFGTAQIDLKATPSFTLKESSADFLLELWHVPLHSLFTQWGIRDSDDRLITNFGVGHRYVANNWLLGYNAFYDTTWQTRNQRWGIGLEAWRDYLKFSANGYYAISGWQHSHLHDGYDERPANGWDLRAEGWLPFLPQVGAKMIYERYHGDNVALSHFSQRQRNPIAMTAGANYTPIPLVSFGVDYQSGTHHISETRLNMAMQWRFGESLASQLDPQAIAGLRQLKGSRLDLVNRNNVIAMDYRQRETLSLVLPSEIRGNEYATWPLTPTITSTHKIARLEFDDAALVAAGGKILSNTPQKVTLQLPGWQQGQSVPLSAVAVDVRGNRSKPAFTRIWTQSQQHTLTLAADKTTLLSDGVDAAMLTLHVNNIAGISLANEPVSLTTDGGTLRSPQGKTDARGDFYTTLVSTQAGVFHVTAIDGAQKITHSGITFHNTMHGTLTTSRTSAYADGQQAIDITLQLTDAMNRPASGKAVRWNTTLGALSQNAAITAEDGRATIRLTSVTPGSATVTATTDEESWQTPALNFRREVWALRLTPDKTSALASGFDTVHYTLSAHREDGSPASGEKVSWSTTLGTVSDVSTQLDRNGEAHLTLTSTQTGTAQVSASLHGQQTVAQDVQFTEIFYYFLTLPPSAKVGESVRVRVLNAVDNNGNIMTGENISWSSTGGHLSQTSGTIDSAGEASVTFTADEPGHYYITSILRGNSLRGSIDILP
jgi:hypothetical protein